MTIFGDVTEGADRTATGDGMSGVKDSGRESGHANIDAIDPNRTKTRGIPQFDVAQWSFGDCSVVCASGG
jgi:hypothetical protein